MEVLFLAWGVRLCIMVRKAPSEFNESRFISMAIYNEFLLTCFLNVSMWVLTFFFYYYQHYFNHHKLMMVMIMMRYIYFKLIIMIIVLIFNKKIFLSTNRIWCLWGFFISLHHNFFFFLKDIKTYTKNKIHDTFSMFLKAKFHIKLIWIKVLR